MGNGEGPSQGRRRRRRGRRGRGRGRSRASAETAPPQADSVQEDDDNNEAQPDNTPSDDTSPVSGNPSSSHVKTTEDQGPSLEGDLSRSPAKPEAAGEQVREKNESWRQPEGEKDITKFRFPVKGDGSLLRYIRRGPCSPIKWGSGRGGRHVSYKELP